MKERLLFVISDFLYLNNANSICINNILNELKDIYKIDIITNENTNEQDINANGVTLYRGIGFSIDEKMIVNRISHLKCDNSIKRVFLFITKCLLAIFKLTIWPEISIFSRTAIIRRAVQLIKKSDYVAMVSCAGNINSHVFSFEIKKFSSIKWIAISFDPLPNENYVFKHRALLNFNIKKIEKRIFKYADAITFTNNLYYLYLKRGECVTNKLFLLDFPLYISDNRDMRQRRIGITDSVELLYMGSLNKKVRNIDYLCELLSHIYDKNIILNIIGDSVIENKYNIVIKNYGYLLHDDAIKIAKLKRYIGINLGNNNRYSVPSKIFDYISLNLPIISIEILRNVPTDYYLKKYGNYLTIWEGDGVTRNLEKLNAFISSCSTSISSINTDKMFETNSPRYVAKRIKEIILKI